MALGQIFNYRIKLCAQIVDKSSAVLNLPNERLLPVDADHREMCRFSDPKDPRFQPVISAVDQMMCESVAMEGLFPNPIIVRSRMKLTSRR